MKNILLLIALFSLKNPAMAQDQSFPDNTKIYLVRHAEKESGRDPLLTEAGKKRAGDLMRTLKGKKIARIYVTNYKRSWMTADSVRIQLGIDTSYYAADTTGEGLINEIRRNNDFGKTILVIGHTNTIPPLIRALGVKDYMLHELPDEEFDNLFLVKYKGNKVFLEHKKYGTKSTL